MAETSAPPRIEAVVIGASAGGVAALLQLLPGLPAAYPLPIVVVLHLPAQHESRLAEVLQFRVALAVREARDKEPLAAGTVYIAPADHHLSIEADRSFSLSGEAPVCFARPSIDVLMSSAAQVYGASLIGLLLTGANSDGAAGLAAIKAAGGLSGVQLPAEAQVPTMPNAALRLHDPDYVLPLAGLHELLLRFGH